jgi:hypothetical protein
VGCYGTFIHVLDHQWTCAHLPLLSLLQVREIVGQLREGRQSLMFSATLPRSLADFAAAGLNNPQLVRLDAERKLSPDLGLAFFTGKPAVIC